MLSEGHAAATRYPLGYMFNEVKFAKRRINAKMRTDAILMHAVAMDAMSTKGGSLNKMLEKLDGE